MAAFRTFREAIIVRIRFTCTIKRKEHVRLFTTHLTRPGSVGGRFWSAGNETNAFINAATENAPRTK